MLGSFTGGMPNQTGSAFGGGTNPFQSGNTGGGFFGGQGMPAQTQNPFMGGQPSQQSGGGFGFGGMGGMPPPMQNPFMGGQQPQGMSPPPPMPPAPMQNPQGNPSGVNPFQPPQLSPKQQQLTNWINSKMQPLSQQMGQLQQQYMVQPPLQFDQKLQKMPEYQAMQKAAQSGNFEEANRLRNAFESTPQFKQFELTRNAHEQQQQQAQQKMMADPRFQQLQKRMDAYQRFLQKETQQFQPQPQVLPAQPRPQVLPAQSLGTGLASLINRGMM